MYVDSVYVKHFQEVAQLISPMTTAPMSGCLSFYYQLQQGNDNVFSLYTRDVTGLYEEIWKTNSPENPAWNLAEVEFSAPYPMEVRVAGVPAVPAVPWPGHSTGLLPTHRHGGAIVSHLFFLFCCVCLYFQFPSSTLFSAFLLYHLHFLTRLFFLRMKATNSISRAHFPSEPCTVVMGSSNEINAF